MTSLAPKALHKPAPAHQPHLPPLLSLHHRLRADWLTSQKSWGSPAPTCLLLCSFSCPGLPSFSFLHKLLLTLQDPDKH